MTIASRKDPLRDGRDTAFPPWLPFFVLGFGAGLSGINSFDLFWHIQAGSLMIRELAVLRSNYFSWTFPDHPWTPTYWLFEITLAAIHAATGLKSLVIFHALCVGALFTMLGKSLSRRLPSWLTLLLLLNLLDLSLFRLLLRPHLFTFLGLAWCMERADTWLTRPSLKRDLWPVVLVFSLWSNFHSGVVYGLVFLALCALGRLPEWFGHGVDGSTAARGFRKLGSVFLLGVAATAASGLNPGGFQWVGYVRDHLTMDNIIPLEEFAPLEWSTHAKVILTLAVLHGLPLLVLLTGKRLPLTAILLALWSLWLLTKGIRLVPKVVLLSLPAWGDLGRILKVSPLFRSLPKWLGGGKFLWVMTLLFLAWLHGFSHTARYPYFQSGLGLHQPSFPVQVAPALDPERFRRPYNSFSTGGYLLYRHQNRLKVFQDGRIHAYPPSFIREAFEAGQSAAAFGRLATTYDLDSALVNRDEDPGAIAFLENNPQTWECLADDGNFAVYARKIKSIETSPENTDNSFDRKPQLLNAGFD